MQNNENDKIKQTGGIMELRKHIYSLESINLHRKVPQDDLTMVEKVIAEIKRFVENEEAK